jgi:hypothetical protein
VRKMINLLFIAKDISNLIIRNYSFLEKELAKITNLMIWRESGEIKDIIKQLPKKPDFILIQNDIGGFGPVVNGLADIGIPTGLFINDAHRFVDERKAYIQKNNIQYLFSVVREKFYELYPMYRDRFIWFPHYINPEIFKDYKEEKKIPLLMLGAVSDLYPLRQKILKFYQNNKNFVYQSHPGYRQFSEDNKELIGENYARLINQAKIFFTTGSVLKYPVLKYFEVPACKTLLLAPTFKELEDLGFIPGKHFVAINETNFASLTNAYLNNEKARNEIIEQGHKFILENHTLEIRAKQLVEKIKEIISKG